MINYRFYVLNQQDHITHAHVAECNDLDDIQREALSLLAEHPAAAAIEVWDPQKLIYRSERPTTVPRSSNSAA